MATTKKNAIKVVEKNPGTKIAYEQSGTKIIFGDDELMVNAAKYQRDWPVQIDICADGNQNLVVGVGAGRYYVAQLDIPATEYDETETEKEVTEIVDGEEVTKTVTATEKTAQPLDMSKAVLTLWSLDDLIKAN